MDSNQEKTKLEEQIKSLSQQASLLQSEIDQYRNQLISLFESQPGIKEQLSEYSKKLENTFRLMNGNLKKIDDHYHQFQKLNNSGISKIEEFNNAFTKVEEKTKEVENFSKQIDELKTSIFGNEKQKIIGQQQRLNEHETQVKEDIKKWENSYNALFNKIEGLLPGASSTGLAKAYQDQRATYTKPYWIWSIAFVATILGIIIFSITHLKDAQTINDVILRVISRLPILIPAFWLAIFASKQQSQYKRLQQEYAYKEALAKSYEADKREIEKLADKKTKEELSEKLIHVMIDSAKFNPSETLGSRIHNDSPPSLLDLFKWKTYKKLTEKAEQPK